MNVRQYTEENPLYEKRELILQEEMISFCLEPGAVREGSFVIASADGKKVKGRVYTSHWRMQCHVSSHFQGARSEIAYLFDSTGMQPGDTIRGEFQIISDAGEYRIPFAVTAQPHYITTPEGALKNLAAFVSLTDLDMDAAYQAFSHPQFVNTLERESRDLLRWYRGLIANGITYESMNSFLKLIGHYKEPAREPSLKSELKKFYEAGNVDYARREYKQRVVRLLRLYLQFRSMALPLDKWAKETKELLEPMMTRGRYKDFYYMAMVHVYLLEGEQSFARKKLDDYADTHYDLQRNPALYGYYLYLCALLRRSDSFLEQACGQIRALYERHPESGMLLWVLQMVDKELLTDDKKRCRMMEEIHNMGVRTPVLYIEACMLYRQNPALIGQLSDYEVQVLVFAKRNQLLSQEMMDRIAELALRYKEFSVTMYSLLEQCYEANPQTKCIHAICTLLIKGNKIGDEYFKWYEKGVEANLRITRLYDYYLYSMKENMDQPLPEAVLTYFQYNQDLDYRKKAFLFANLTKFKEDYPDLYDTYYQDMIDFVLRQLEKGRVNANLIYLYQNMVNRQYISQKNAFHIADFVFSYRITGLPEKAVKVVVREPSLTQEMIVPVTGGEAVASIYTDEACVYYQDAKGNRQAITDRSGFQRWFEKEELLEPCGRYCPVHPGIMLRKCRALTDGKDPQWQMTLAQLTAEQQFSFAFRMGLWQKMLDHFYETYDNDALEWCLQHVRLQELPDEKRSQNIELLLILSRYEEAYAYITTYGCEHISDKLMVRLCSRMICVREFVYDENLMNLCREIFFRGKYDEIMLSYLLDHGDGGTRELEALWQAGEQFGLDTYQIAKKLLSRVLFTKFLPDRLYDIFESYYRAKGRENLVLAFLTYFAGGVVAKDMQIDKRIYEWIRKELAKGEQMNETCRIAWLYGISRYPELVGDQEERAAEILQGLLNDGKYFAFFNMLPQSLTAGRLFLEQTVLEHHTHPDNRVYLHYRIQGQDAEAQFRVEEMEQSFPGVFVKELMLFSMDRAQYYISEQRQDREWISRRGVLEPDSRRAAKGDRYDCMETLLASQKEEQQEMLTAAYVQQAYITDRLFQCL